MHYRLYYMSPQTGHIERYDEFEAPDDGQATRMAEAQLGKQPLELWSGHRKLRRYPYGPGFAGEGGSPAQANSVSA